MLSSVFGLLCLRRVPQSSHTYSVTAVVDNEVVWTVTYLLIIPKRKEKRRQAYCLVNCACCWAKKVVQAFTTLVLKSVRASTVLL